VTAPTPDRGAQVIAQGRLVPMVSEEEAAAREAAAREEGRAEVQAEMDAAVHALLGQRDAEEGAAKQLRAERAGLFTEIGVAAVEIARLRAEVTKARIVALMAYELGLEDGAARDKST
jgi:hypothetical protein